jgi:ferredoxin
MGSGMCVFHAPNTFDVDDEMRVVLLPGPGDDAAAIKAAVDGCPTHALQLEEADDSGQGGNTGVAR